MKKFLFIAMLLLSAQNFASEINFKCYPPKDVTWINRFSVEGTLEVDDLDQNPQQDISATSFSADFTRAGNDMPTNELFMNDLKGRVLKVDNSELTKYPYYNVTLINKETGAYINLNIDYPSNLSSRIRTEEGYTYRSKCYLD